MALTESSDERTEGDTPSEATDSDAPEDDVAYADEPERWRPKVLHVAAAAVALLIGGLVTADGLAWSRSSEDANALALKAALAAARALQDPDAAVVAALQAAGISPALPWRAQRGTVKAGEGPAADRFEPVEDGNNVRVQLETHFRPLIGRLFKIGVGVEGVAVAERVASVSLELAARGGRPGPAGLAILGALLGADLVLTDDDWNGFVGSAVDVESFVRALDRPGTTWADKLAAPVPVSVALGAIAEGLPKDEERAKLTARRLALAAEASTVTIRPDQLLSVPGTDALPAGEPLGALPHVRAGDLLAALARAAGSGHATTFTLTSPAPGITAIEGEIRLPDDESSKFTAIGDLPARFSTPSASLSLRVEVTGGTLPGAAGLAFPLELEVGSGEVTVEAAVCEGPPAVEATARSAEAVLRFALPTPEGAAAPEGPAENARPPVPLIDVPGIRAWVRGSTELTRGQALPIRFSANDIQAAVPRFSRAPLDLEGLLKRLAGSTQVLVDSDAGTAPPATVRDEIMALFEDATPAMATIVSDVLSAVRITPGAVDLVVHEANCLQARPVE